MRFHHATIAILSSVLCLAGGCVSTPTVEGQDPDGQAADNLAGITPAHSQLELRLEPGYGRGVTFRCEEWSSCDLEATVELTDSTKDALRSSASIPVDGCVDVAIATLSFPDYADLGVRYNDGGVPDTAQALVACRDERGVGFGSKSTWKQHLADPEARFVVWVKHNAPTLGPISVRVKATWY